MTLLPKNRGHQVVQVSTGQTTVKQMMLHRFLPAFSNTGTFLHLPPTPHICTTFKDVRIDSHFSAVTESVCKMGPVFLRLCSSSVVLKDLSLSNKNSWQPSRPCHLTVSQLKLVKNKGIITAILISSYLSAFKCCVTAEVSHLKLSEYNTMARINRMRYAQLFSQFKCNPPIELVLKVQKEGQNRVTG